MTRDPSNAPFSPIRPHAGGDPVVIGLVNNMPDAALKATEAQFAELVSAAAHGRPTRFELYALPEVPRSDAAREHIQQHYLPLATLYGRGVDALIVTGTQPRCRNLPDEPYWPSFTRLVDWAERNTISTIWSCLAAHAAVYHMDGIERRPFVDKLSGVFTCTTFRRHALAEGFPTSWPVPHSRYNDLPEDALRASGYHVLSRSDQVGVDLFVKQRASLFLFFQGHPEYDRASLLREYRADIVKFLNGERQNYPGTPENYFDDETMAALRAYRRRAELEHDTTLLPCLPLAAAEARLTARWRAPAIGIYKSWFDYLAERKELESKAGESPFRPGRRDEGAASALHSSC